MHEGAPGTYMSVFFWEWMDDYTEGWADKWLRETESQPARYCTLPSAAPKPQSSPLQTPVTSLKTRAQAESLLKFIAEGEEQFITDIQANTASMVDFF